MVDLLDKFRYLDILTPGALEEHQDHGFDPLCASCQWENRETSVAHTGFNRTKIRKRKELLGPCYDCRKVAQPDRLWLMSAFSETIESGIDFPGSPDPLLGLSKDILTAVLKVAQQVVCSECYEKRTKADEPVNWPYCENQRLRGGEPCEEAFYARDLCQRHYMQSYRAGELDTLRY